MGVIGHYEYFKPLEYEYDEITILDCNDSFTHNLVGEFLSLGAPISVYNSHQANLDEVIDNIGKYLVLSPGPGRPKESGIANDVYHVIKGKIPTLGVCLGMQLINEYFGGLTLHAPKVMHGKTSIIEHDSSGIYRGVKNPTTVARYHSLMIKPVGKDIQIQSIAEGIIMGIRNKKYNTVGIQFHPESFMTLDGNKMLNNFLEGVI